MKNRLKGGFGNAPGVGLDEMFEDRLQCTMGQSRE